MKNLRELNKEKHESYRLASKNYDSFQSRVDSMPDAFLLAGASNLERQAIMQELRPQLETLKNTALKAGYEWQSTCTNLRIAVDKGCSRADEILNEFETRFLDECLTQVIDDYLELAGACQELQ